MRTIRTLMLSSLLLIGAGAAVPAFGAVLRPVAPQELDQFIGWTVWGEARSPLGVIASADERRGVIGVVGRHGEFALMDSAMLAKNGLTLRAPTVSTGEFAFASTMRMHRPDSIIAQPRIIIEEPPAG